MALNPVESDKSARPSAPAAAVEPVQAPVGSRWQRLTTWPRQAGALLTVCLAFGAVLRVVVSRSILGRPNADEAVAMLMARHVADGEFRSFYWGNNYGGTLSSFVEAPFVKVFGTHILMFRAINSAMVLGCALLVGWIAFRLFDREVGRLAACLFWIFPPLWVLLSTWDFEFYAPGMLIALATAAACIRSNDPDSERWLWAIGLGVGLSFWAFPLLGCIVVPAVVARLWSARRRLTIIFKALVLIPVGALPWIYSTLSASGSLNSPPPTQVGVYARILRSITVVLPSTFVTYTDFAVSPTARAVAGVVVFVTVAVVAERAVRARNWQLPVVAAPLLLWPFLLAASDVFLSPATARYGLFVLPTTSILLAVLLRKLRADVVVVAFAGALTLMSFSAVSAGLAVVPRFGDNLGALADHLDATGRRHVYASYWTAYPLSLLTQERVTAAPLATSRYPPYDDAAGRSRSSTYVVQGGNKNDRTLRAWLAEHGGGRRVTIGDFIVYEFDRRVTPRNLPPLQMEPE